MCCAGAAEEGSGVAERPGAGRRGAARPGAAKSTAERPGATCEG